MMQDQAARRLTQAFIHLDRLTHNLKVLRSQAGKCPFWPVVKANAYGHGAEIVARHVTALGYHTLGVADVAEAIQLKAADINATLIVLSAGLPEHSEALVALGCEPAVCTHAMVAALAARARSLRRRVAIHVKVDTGMGRLGIRPEDVTAFLEHCRSFPEIRVRGLMSHFPRADEADKTYSLRQLDRFKEIVTATRNSDIECYHIANSAGIMDIPGSLFDAARPGIAMYGLPPSTDIVNPCVQDLEPVLEWKSRIVFLKEVPAETGLSYGHAFQTVRPSLIATVPAGYGDGLSRNLSNGFEMLVGGRRCPQVGRITMDMSLLDVTELRGTVQLGDEVVIVGQQGGERVTADELAAILGTLNYEIVTAVAHRVPRVVVESVHP